MSASNPHRTTKNTDKQLLRRAFDTFYEFDAVETAKEAEARLRRVKRRTRWMVATAVAAVVFIGVMFTFMQLGVQEVQESRMPTLQERLAAPYDLTTERVNLSIAAGMPDLDGFTFRNVAFEDLDPVLGCMMAPHNCELSIGNIPVAVGVIDPNTATEEEIAAWQAENTIEYDENGQPIVPEPEVVDLMVFSAIDGVIAGQYSNEETDVRLAVAQFATQADAYEAILTMYDYARSVGHIGNYALGTQQAVPYYYASGRGWIDFVWMQENSIFQVKARSWRDLEDVIAQLQALPPLPTGMAG